MKPDKLHTKEKVIVVPGSNEQLSNIRDFVKTTVSEIGLPDKSIGDMQLAVDEWCTNIIKYAYHNQNDKIIKIKINWNSTKCYISIIDFGPPFDPKNVPAPDLEKYYRQQRVGGFGIHLMKTLMDEVKYTSVKDSYNEILLIKNFNKGD